MTTTKAMWDLIVISEYLQAKQDTTPKLTSLKVSV